MLMSQLDRAELWERIDTRSMRDLLNGFPHQLRDGLERVRGLKLPMSFPVHNVVVLGMGGSAIGGDVARAAVSDLLRVPLLVNRDCRVPAFVGSQTLAIASSYSGNTEETIAAYEAARQAGAWIACLSSGGRLAQMAQRDGRPILRMPGGLPPRAALGYSTVMILGILSAAQLVSNLQDAVEEATGLLASMSGKLRPEVPAADNPAKSLASALHGKLIAVYASGGILGCAAYRWRCQIEENAKNLALHHTLPEMDHNELVGWEMPPEILRRTAVVFLRDCAETPQVRHRVSLTSKLVQRRSGSVHEVFSSGGSPLARVMSTIYLGDFVSYYLACLNAVDPTPVEVIEMLKRELAALSPGLVQDA
jgi:glucose/mannose-6-phosphate isomerase